MFLRVRNWTSAFAICTKSHSAGVFSTTPRAGPRAPSEAAIEQARASVLEIGRLMLGRQQRAVAENKEEKEEEAVEEGQGEEGGGGAYLCERKVKEKDDENQLEGKLQEQETVQQAVVQAPRASMHSRLPFTSSTRFDEFPLSSASIRALHEVLNFEMTTLVQERSLDKILQGKDVIVKSNPGSGKTLAFLLPAIESVLDGCANMDETTDSIYSVILCPAREIAMQIFYEAQTLLQFHNGIQIEIITGGFRIAKERLCLQMDPCQILVTTPGRLLDHLQSTDGFKRRLEKLQLLVIDEADQVLYGGQKSCMDEVFKLLPPDRQTLLFCATMLELVKTAFKCALKDNFVYIDMADSDCSNHVIQIKQKFMCSPVEKQLALLHSILTEHSLKVSNYKVLVFCVTARVTSLVYELFKELGFPCMEMHSKKGQMFRFHTYKDFKNSEGSIILFTSDVSSHGVEYPNVTLVVQVGRPEHEGRYINRVGRTGRGGKDGESVLLLLPWEECFIDELCNQCIERAPLPEIDPDTDLQIKSILSKMDYSILLDAYRTWLAYYLSLPNLHMGKEAIVRYANKFSAAIGFQTPPKLSRNLIKKMNLQQVTGIVRKEKRVVKKARRFQVFGNGYVG